MTRPKAGYGLVTIIVKAMLQPIWLCDLGFQLVDWSLYFTMSRIREKSDPTHSCFYIWWSAENYMVGMISLLISPDQG